MKKTINALFWVSVFFTILALLFTIFTTYHFGYIRYFENYFTLQWCLFFTLLILGIRMFDIKTNTKGTICAVICMLMAAGTIFFIFMKVY